MDKNDFLLYLENGLIERGIDPALASKHVVNFGNTINEEDEEEINSIDDPDDLNVMIEEMADFLKQRLQQKKKPQTSPLPAQLQQNQAGQQNQTEDDFLNVPTMEIPSLSHGVDFEVVNKPRKSQSVINQNASASNTVPREQRYKEYVEESSGEDVNREKTPGTPKIEFNYDSVKYLSADATTKGKAIFWGGFVFTLPLTAFIFLGITGAFFGLMGGLSVLIVGLIAGLVAMIASGSALSLVGIIYGITQLFVSVPIGVYEIGLGIIITGFMMLAGILIYNFAIRLLPFVIKQIYKFFQFYLLNVKRLFNYLKGECYTL